MLTGYSGYLPRHRGLYGRGKPAGRRRVSYKTSELPIGKFLTTTHTRAVRDVVRSRLAPLNGMWERIRLTGWRAFHAITALVPRRSMNELKRPSRLLGILARCMAPAMLGGCDEIS